MPIFEPESDPADLMEQRTRVSELVHSLSSTHYSLTEPQSDSIDYFQLFLYYTYVMIRVIVRDEYEIDRTKDLIRLLAVASPNLS